MGHLHYLQKGCPGMKDSSVLGSQTDSTEKGARTAICIEDPIDRRRILKASVIMGISSTILNSQKLEIAALEQFDMIIADEACAREIESLFAEREDTGERVGPAIIVAFRSGPGHQEESHVGFDALLRLPMTASRIAERLAVVLHAHRAFTKRYRSTWQELHLNRRIFHSVTTGISVANASLPDMPLIYVNPAFEAMTGYSRAEVQGKNGRFLEGEERNQPGLTAIRDAVKNRRKGVAVLKNFRKDGTPFWNELSLSPISNADGELTHFVGIQTDVTTRVDFETALRESEKLAAVGRLASSIAHEINNPLASVMNLIYIAERTECSQETKEHLAVADRELRRVKLITEQSLKFLRQSSQPQPTNSIEMFDSIVDIYQTRARNAGVLTQRRDRASEPIVCMESEIRQVLTNLVSNAIYAMQEHGGRLMIRSHEATQWRTGGKGVLFTVADTGTGMSSETLKHIYKAFFTTKSIRGTGLGLWISHEIVERHHGCLKVRSSQRAGKAGTVFQLFLPYAGISYPEKSKQQLTSDISNHKDDMRHRDGPSQSIGSTSLYQTS
jgi:two-component system, sporulation sensor kinase C